MEIRAEKPLYSAGIVVGDQFEVIDAGTRGRRRWIGLLVVLLLLAVPVIGLLLSRDPKSVTPDQVPPGETSPGQTAPGQAERSPSPGRVPGQGVAVDPLTGKPKVVPPEGPGGDDGLNVLHGKPVHRGGDEVIKVVFPDGTVAEVRYPAALRLHRMGSRPAIGVWVPGSRPMVRMLSAPLHGESDIARGRTALRMLTPTVSLWASGPDRGGSGEDLLFSFGLWFMSLHDSGDGMLFDERVALAEALSGTSGPDGYLVLTAKKPARLARPGEQSVGQAVGPQLWFGAARGNALALVLNPGCRPNPPIPAIVIRNGSPLGSTCMNGIQLFATGDSTFIDQARSGIKLQRE